LLEQALGRKATLELLPMQAGDMHATAADISDIHAAAGFLPATSIETGIANFARWYLDYADGGRAQQPVGASASSERE
jgi:UDP-glucuronate 4-epimerase